MILYTDEIIKLVSCQQKRGERKRVQSRERSKNYQEQKRAATADEFTDEISVSPASSFQSRMEKKRALDQTKNVLPQTPENNCLI